MSWRGIVVPVLTRSSGFAHDGVQHKFQYRDGEFIERTGAQNPTWTYTIPFRQDIAAGPYSNLFTEVFLRFVEACLDRSPGVLIDPIWGEQRCVVTSLNEDSDNNKRDGTDVRVEFTRAPEIDETAQAINGGVSSLQGVATEAGILDQEITTVPWEQEDSPGATSDPFSLVSGTLSQIERNGHKISAALDDVAYRAEKVEAAANRLEDPKTFQIVRSSRRVQAAAKRAKDRVDNADRTVFRVLVRYTKTTSQIAAENGMTLQELLALNPGLARSPRVAPGTKINVYR